MSTHGTKNADTLVGLLKEMNEIWGHSGDDDLGGGMLADTIRGGKDNDRVWAGGGDDVIFGDTGNDTLYGTEGNDTVRGGIGNDWVSGGKGSDVTAGGKGNDTVHGNSGDDVVLGGSGDDTVLVSSGVDLYSGGSGNDVLDFSRVAVPVNVDLSKGIATFGTGKNGVTDKISGFETIVGNDAAGRYVGADKTGTWFIGGDSADWFRGKGGADTLTGNGGADTFAYLKKDTAGGAVDRITDFTVGTDRLDMSDFLKGHKSYAESVRFADAGSDTIVQGLVKGQWVDVVSLDGVDSQDVGFSILV